MSKPGIATNSKWTPRVPDVTAMWQYNASYDAYIRIVVRHTKIDKINQSFFSENNYNTMDIKVKMSDCASLDSFT